MTTRKPLAIFTLAALCMLPVIGTTQAQDSAVTPTTDETTAESARWAELLAGRTEVPTISAEARGELRLMLSRQNEFRARSKLVTPPTSDTHQPLVDLRLTTVTPEIRFAAGAQQVETEVSLDIAPSNVVIAAKVVLVAAGVGVQLDGADPTTRDIKYLPDLPQIGSVERSVRSNSLRDTSIAQPFRLTFDKLSWGYLFATVDVARGNPFTDDANTVLYFAASEHRVVFRYGSLAEIAEEFTYLRLLAGQYPANARLAVQRMRERGVFSRITPDLLSEPQLTSTMSRLASALPLSISLDTCPVTDHTACALAEAAIGGMISFEGHSTWPVTDAFVQLVQVLPGRDECIAQTRTNDGGRYLFCVDPAQFSDKLAVRSLSAGPKVAVVRCVAHSETSIDCNPDRVLPINAFALRSTPFDAGSVTIDLPEPLQTDTNAARALGVFESVNLARRTLDESGVALAPNRHLPAQVLVAYSQAPIGTSTPVWTDGRVFIEVSYDDRKDWDVIQHEFGHIVQHFGGLSTLPSGSHGLNVDLCSGRTYLGTYRSGLDYPRDEAIQLAWSEAWAGWFSIWSQRPLRGRFSPDKASVGDLKWENTFPLSATLAYDIEANKHYVVENDQYVEFDAKWLGEGNEVAIQRALWDLGDGIDEEESDHVDLGHKAIWSLVASNTPAEFSGFVAALSRDIGPTQDRPIESALATGAILANQGISPGALPAGKLDWLLGTWSVSWDLPYACTDGDANAAPASFDLAFYDSGLRQRKAEISPAADSNSAVNGVATAGIPWGDRFAIFGMLNDRVWSSEATNIESPATGPYQGSHTTAYFCGLLWLGLLAVALVVAWFLLKRPNLVWSLIVALIVLGAFTAWLYYRSH